MSSTRSSPLTPPASPLKVVVVGSGISGLMAAHCLQQNAPEALQVTLIEAGNHFGGHAHAVDITFGGKRFAVDCGFLVFNHATYPGLVQLFESLGVETAPASMGFSAQVSLPGGRKLEWAGNNLSSVFAQRRQLFSPAHWRMLRDILRFNRITTDLALQAQAQREGWMQAQLQESVGDFLARHGFSAAFEERYLLPMLACIWSCPSAQMRQFPIATLIRFCHNHGLLQVNRRPPWYTVKGSSRRYVEKIIAQLPRTRLSCPVERIERHAQGVDVHTRSGVERFDAVVLATHSTQSLALLGAQATEVERDVLGAIRYQSNTAVLHSDCSLMPQSERAWAAWNFEGQAHAASEEEAHSPRAVCLHYWLNALQPLPARQPVLVTLNPLREPDPTRVFARLEFEHPVFDAAAIAAQQRVNEIQGHQSGGRIWYAGAWCGYGFHEDGLQSGLRAAHQLLSALPRLQAARRD